MGKRFKAQSEITVAQCLCGSLTAYKHAVCPYTQPEDEEYLNERLYLGHESAPKDSAGPDAHSA